MRKLILFACIIFMSAIGVHAQSIANATIGTISGQLTAGGITLSFTLGEVFAGKSNASSVNLSTGFWPTVVSPHYASTSKTVYTFIGNGNFSNPVNWEGGIVPPNPLPGNAEIIIAPAAVDAFCVLDIPISVSSGGKFSVLAGKRIIVPGDLELQ